MNAGRDVERLIATWLAEEAPGRAPDRVLLVAGTRIDRTHQRRIATWPAGWFPWRSPVMNRFAIPAVAALAVVLAAVLLIPRFVSNNIGPQPSPSNGPTLAPTASAPPLTITRSMEGGTLGGGTYQVNEFAAPLSVTVPAGWVVSEAKPNNFVLRSPDNEFLTVVVMDRIYPDPCHTDVDAAPFTPGVDGLIAALGAMQGFSAQLLRNESVGGAGGHAFTLTNSIDPRAAGCSSPEVLSIGTYDLDGTQTNVLETGGSSDLLWAVYARGLAVLIGGPQAIVDEIEFVDPNILQTVEPSAVNKALRPGMYAVRGFAVDLSVTVPAGWTVNGLERNSFGVESRADGKNNVGFVVIDRIYGDPCKPRDGGEAVFAPGSTIDQRVEAFTAMKGFRVTDVQGVIVGGKQAKGFTISNAIDLASSGCAGTTLPIANYDKNGTRTDITMFPRESDHFWLVDVGGTIVLIAITNTPAILEATQTVFDSISFGSPTN